MQIPVIDLHCDLTSYLDAVPGSSIYDSESIGCSIPHLIHGNVELQIMAIFALTERDSSACGERQFSMYEHWQHGHEEQILPIQSAEKWRQTITQNQILCQYAIENASCFSEEDEPLQDAFARLNNVIERIGKPVYITITHHAENRFGGGNLTEIGLKDDGRRLLEFLSEKQIAVDMSHTSDEFAAEILQFIDSHKLDIPILASHSNFRSVWEHARNLPDWLAKEISNRGGVVGINFVRDFVNPDHPEMLMDHIAHGLSLGCNMTFAADYFSPAIMPPQFAFREPYFHPEHQDARCYPTVLAQIQKQFGEEIAIKIAHQNALKWLHKLGTRLDLTS